MRKRKEIMNEYIDNLSITTVQTYRQNKLILEVLLDIRGLLEKEDVKE